MRLKQPLEPLEEFTDPFLPDFDFHVHEKKGGSGKTVQNTDPWSGQQPYLRDAFSEAQKVYQSGGPQFYDKPTYVPFSPQSEMGMELIQQRALSGSPLIQQAQSFVGENLSESGPNMEGVHSNLNSLMQGGQINPQSLDASNLPSVREVGAPGSVRDVAATGQGFDQLSGIASGNANPYLDKMFGAASDAVTKRFSDTVMPGINSTFGAGGRTGSGLHSATVGSATDELGNDLTNMASTIYGNAYESDANRALQAATTLGGANLSAQQSNQGVDSQGRALGLQADMANQGQDANLRNIASQFGLANQSADLQGQGMDLQSRLNAAGQLGSLNRDQNQFQSGLLGQSIPLANQDYQDFNQLLNVGQQVEGKAGQVLADDMNRFNHYQNLPEQNLANYIAAIQGNYGGSSTQKNTPSFLSQAGDAVSTAAAMAALFSDGKLKSDVETIKQWGPIRLVRWVWNAAANQLGLEGDDVGFIAGEVERVAPQFVTEKQGYKAVDYIGLLNWLRGNYVFTG